MPPPRLARGCDTLSVRRLAALMGSETEEVGPLLDRALAELGSPQLGDADGVSRLAREISQAIVAGTTAPYHGATFIYAASEWGERPEDRQRFEEGIVVAAREL
jgi:hypothetical protein